MSMEDEMSPKANPVGGDRSKWVRSTEFARYWLSLNEEIQNDYPKLITAFQSKGSQLTEDNIKTKMKTCEKKWEGLPPIPSPNRYTESQLLKDFAGLRVREK